MIAREGWLLIAVGLVLTIVAIWIADRWDSRLAFLVSLLVAILTLFTAFFFRDPERSVVREPNVLLAPADGTVVAVETLAGYPGLIGEVIQISIFLSVLDVHINRVPTTGRIDYVKYVPGRFMAAFKGKASQENEHTEIGLTTEYGRKLVFKQIAGLIARRIVCRLKGGEAVEAGERFGMIRFGSRVDLLVPADSRLHVKMGDKVHGGKTIIGYMSGTPTHVDRKPPARENNATL